MAKIMHSDMKRGKGVPASVKPQPETYIVDDMSGSNGEEEVDTSLDRKLAEFEGSAQEEIAVPEQKKEEVKQPEPKKKKEPSKMLEKLIFMGRHVKEIEIAGHKFELSTLTHKENNDIVRRLMNFGEAADLFTIRVFTLACALKKIDDVPLDEIDIGEDFDSNDEEDVLEKRVTIIDNMQLELVERLHAQYESMIKESQSVVYGDAVKN